MSKGNVLSFLQHVRKFVREQSPASRRIGSGRSGAEHYVGADCIGLSIYGAG
jgi:hypothetical protein